MKLCKLTFYSHRVLMVLLLACLFTSTARADNDIIPQLAGMDIEALANIEVTSASKKPEPSFEAASAIFVLTSEDIVRSGAKTIPEVLRQVPGVNVAQISSGTWAITARGFNGEFASKLLVLIDGRAVYTPLFSGVYWDFVDVPLENIERIEVIRGPGGALWGANAVNGVINIITKDSKSIQGTLVNAGGGNVERGFGMLRHGGSVGDEAYYSVYGRYTNNNDYDLLSGQSNEDEWDAFQFGGRVDWTASESDQVMISAGGKSLNSGFLTTSPDSLSDFAPMPVEQEIDHSGMFLHGKWEHTSAEDHKLILSGYYDYSRRDQDNVDEKRHTFDLDIQYNLALSPWVQMISGAGYRQTFDETDPSFAVAFIPDSRDDSLFNVFTHFEFELLENVLFASLGTKYEYNDYSGSEIQPAAKLRWSPNDINTIWASVARAIRSPARANSDIRINVSAIPNPDQSTTLISVLGNPDLESENLLAYELGYRTRAIENVWLDFTVFYNDYKDLIVTNGETPFFESNPAPPHLVVPLRFVNGMEGYAYGAEAAFKWRINDTLWLKGSYSYLDLNMDLDSGVNSTDAEQRIEGSSPHNQFHVGMQTTLPYNLELDGNVYYVDSLSFQDVSSYVRTDIRVAWDLTESIELVAVGQNIFDGEHLEFATNESGRNIADVPRSVYGMVTIKLN